MGKFLIRSVLVLLAALAAVVGFFAYFWSGAAPVYNESAALQSLALAPRMRNGAEHDRIVARHAKPYVLELKGASGALVFFGAQHTNDSRDPQLAGIERRWKSLRPTVALYEGRRRGFLTGPVFGLDGVSEAGWVHELARRDKVRLLSLEPSYGDEVASMLEKWKPEQIALYFFTRVYWSEAGGKADDDLAKDLLHKRTDVEGLRGALATLADVDRLWSRDFPGQPGWRTLTGEPEGSYLTAIAEDSRRIRGEHMARTLIELTRKGERVFAVAGSGHVIRLEWMLRTALGASPAPDQPV